MRKDIIAAIAVTCFSTAVLAHDWYDAACCNEDDCAPVTEIKPVEGGEMMTTRKGTFFVNKNLKVKELPSRDMNTHLCATKAVDMFNTEQDTATSFDIIRCIYRPMTN